MSIISAANLTKRFGDRVILNGFSFSVEQNARLGIVGANGAGKSTLLHIISGHLAADGGHCYISNQTSLGFLPQNTVLASSKALIDEMYSEYADVLKYERRQRELEHEMGLHEYGTAAYTQAAEEYARVTEQFNAANGYEIDSRIIGTLTGLGFDRNMFERSVDTFSGGQKTRAALCKMLVRNPDILLLDEPTNHLDIESMQWLGSYLSSYSGTVLLVSHDRYLLNTVCTTILEIENTRLNIYTGNYSEFIEKKERLSEDYLKHYQLQQKELARQKKIIEQFRSYNREKSIKAAESREKQLDKMQMLEAPESMRRIRVEFTAKNDLSNDVLEAVKLSKAFDGHEIFSNISFQIKKGEKIGLLGSNAAGKSTILKIIAGEIMPSSGECRLCNTAELGYFDQEHAHLDNESSILAHVHNAYPGKAELEIRNALAALLFFGDDVFKPLKKLSGGEKARVEFAKLMLGSYNFMLLDEPTNHLDMQSREILEAAITSYPGTLFFVSHDRYFINKAADRLLVLKNGELCSYEGNYDDYLERLNRETRSLSQPTEQGLTKTQQAQKRKAAQLEKKKERAYREEIMQIEKAIEILEKRKAELEETLSRPETYSDTSAMLLIQSEYTEIQQQIDDAYHQWQQAEGGD